MGARWRVVCLLLLVSRAPVVAEGCAVDPKDPLASFVRFSGQRDIFHRLLGHGLDTGTAAVCASECLALAGCQAYGFNRMTKRKCFGQL